MINPSMLDKHLYSLKSTEKRIEDSTIESNAGDFLLSNLCVWAMVFLKGFLKAS